MPVFSSTIALEQFTTFGDVLKYLRRRAGLTQRQLSAAVGYSDAQISRLEQNERLPDLATLTARVVPALHADNQPEVVARLLELAAAVRREDAPAAGLSPYKGLYFFDESDAEMFFGREVLTDALVSRLMAGLQSDERFLAVVGASGSGKSSLVRAGLIPALRWRQPSSAWPVYVMTPTSHPLEALIASLRAESGASVAAKRMVDDLTRKPGALHAALERLAAAAGSSHVLLAVDQFEEMFTLCRNEPAQAAFVENLLNAAFEPKGPGIILLVLRADFYSHCARFDQLRHALARFQEYIGPMTTEELRRAIEEPARRGHWDFEQGLADLLLHDVGAEVGHVREPGALPLLSHALLATWQRRRGRKLTLSGYKATGGIRGAIAETAEAVFHDKLEPEQRVIARQLFLRLTEFGEDASTADTRRRVSYTELAGKPEDAERVHEVLMTLADARLITTHQDSAEVAHEALIREWPTLRSWLEENRQALRLHRHLTDAAHEWESTGQDPGNLYRGVRLAQANEWSAAHAAEMNAIEHSFLEASRAQEEREMEDREAQRQREIEAAHKLTETEQLRAEEQTQSNRRLRRRGLFLSIAFVLMGVVASLAFAFWQRAARAERLATSRELAAASIGSLDVDPERGVLLALEALKEADTLEARNALHRSLPELHLLHTITAHSGSAVDVAFSPDGTRLASIGDDGTIKSWNAFSGEELMTMKAEGSDPSTAVPRAVAFSPDGKKLASSDATEVALWDTATGELLAMLQGRSAGHTTGYNLGVGQVSFSSDGRHVAAANMDGASKIWDVFTHTEILSFPSGSQPAKAISFSPDGSLLATGGDDGIARVWEAASGEQLLELPLGGIIHSVAFSPQQHIMAAASENGSVQIWDSRTGQAVLALPRQSGLYDIVFLPDGNLVTAGQDGTARVWDSGSGQELLTLAGHTSTVIGVTGSPDGHQIATSGFDGTVRVWDYAPGRELSTFPGHADIVWDVAYSPDGSFMASVGMDGTARLWDVAGDRLLTTLHGGLDPGIGLSSLAISPNSEQLAAGGMDGTIEVWETPSGKSLMRLSGHTNMVVGLGFSPDGTRLASASWDGTAKVWDLVAGREITTFAGHKEYSYVTGIGFSADGQHVLTGADDKFVRMWDAGTGQEVAAFSGEGREIYGVALSPDGNLLAMGDQDGNIALWDVGTGEKTRTLTGHAGLILRLAFSQDGTQLASASFDRLAKVWDVITGQELVSLYGNAGNVYGVSFSPDGAYLATAGADGTVRTYSLRMNELRQLALSRVTRTLTDNECRTFLHEESCP